MTVPSVPNDAFSKYKSTTCQLAYLCFASLISIYTSRAREFNPMYGLDHVDAYSFLLPADPSFLNGLNEEMACWPNDL